MKTKNFDKKLNLNKKTIVHLNNGEMRNFYGRGVGPVILTYFCPTNDCTQTCCSCVTDCQSVCTSDPCCDQQIPTTIQS